jgi:hypothetical protein
MEDKLLPIILLGYALAAKMIPPDVLEECTEKARGIAEGEKPVNCVAAAVIIVAVWLVCAALAVFLALRTF